MNNINGVLKKEKNSYWIISSSKEIDRDGEIILPSSFAKSIDSYMSKNPVILWAHDYSKPPIAKAVGYKITDKELKLEIEFAETEFAKEVRYLYDNKFLNTFSVGFIPKQWDYNDNSDRVYTENEILETSAVPVPANAAATMIRQAEERGMELKNFKSLMEVPDSNDTDNSESHEIKEPEIDSKIKDEQMRIIWTK